MQAGGDTPAVVDDRETAVNMDRRLNRLTKTSHVLVDAVVDHLVDEVVQPFDARAPDIHGGTLPDCLEPLQHLDLVSTVLIGFRGVSGLHRFGLPAPLLCGHSSPLVSAHSANRRPLRSLLYVEAEGASHLHLHRHHDAGITGIVWFSDQAGT